MGRTNGVQFTQRIFVFDSPRTCSQLFNKLFASHPQLTQVFHPLMGASVYGPERVWNNLQHCDASETAYNKLSEAAGLGDETYSVATERLEQTVQDIERDDKIPWIKDHSLCVVKPELFLHGAQQETTDPPALKNPTVFSDAFLHSGRPVILIRHPALMIPSFFRTQKPIFHQEAQAEDFWGLSTLRWARLIFDAYMTSSLGKEVNGDRSHLPLATATPIVIEAEDIVYNTRPTIKALCECLAIDPDGVQYEWDALLPEQWPPDPIMQAFFQDLLRSSGVRRAQKPAEANLDLNIEFSKWIEEFGRHDAEALLVWVEKGLPDYEYLSKYKLKA